MDALFFQLDSHEEEQQWHPIQGFFISHRVARTSARGKDTRKDRGHEKKQQIGTHKKLNRGASDQKQKAREMRHEENKQRGQLAKYLKKRGLNRKQIQKKMSHAEIQKEMKIYDKNLKRHEENKEKGEWARQLKELGSTRSQTQKMMKSDKIKEIMRSGKMKKAIEIHKRQEIKLKKHKENKEKGEKAQVLKIEGKSRKEIKEAMNIHANNTSEKKTNTLPPREKSSLNETPKQEISEERKKVLAARQQRRQDKKKLKATDANELEVKKMDKKIERHLRANGMKKEAIEKLKEIRQNMRKRKKANGERVVSKPEEEGKVKEEKHEHVENGEGSQEPTTTRQKFRNWARSIGKKTGGAAAATALTATVAGSATLGIASGATEGFGKGATFGANGMVMGAGAVANNAGEMRSRAVEESSSNESDSIGFGLGGGGIGSGGSSNTFNLSESGNGRHEVESVPDVLNIKKNMEGEGLNGMSSDDSD